MESPTSVKIKELIQTLEHVLKKPKKDLDFSQIKVDDNKRVKFTFILKYMGITKQ